MKEPLMKPEAESLRLFGITRAKGKMYEFGIAEADHIRLANADEPSSLLLLAVATLGDAAAYLNGQVSPAGSVTAQELEFAASYFDALLSSRFAEPLAGDISLLASAAYYLAGRPGSSRVMAARLGDSSSDSPAESALRWLLRNGSEAFETTEAHDDGLAVQVIEQTGNHFSHGSDPSLALKAAEALRDQSYASPSARDLLLGDLTLAVLRIKLDSSSWVCLPKFSQLTTNEWRTAIQSDRFPKELWPSQVAIGNEGLLNGKSGVVQMPTSAGKTRAVELILRAGFLSKRVSLAVVVAPFRALSHEIATSLRRSFADEPVHINELSDALQQDFALELSQFMEQAVDFELEPAILVLTPEKLQFVIRQSPELTSRIDLFVYDEAHQFDSGPRGVTYELLLTELKAGLSGTSQTVAISAVIPNAEDLRNWLIGDQGVLVDGTSLTPTSRTVAFATWLERRGQLEFMEASSYFVPRVIESHRLARLPRERVDRFFPDSSNQTVATDIALYLGLRLAPQGAVAVFAGTKATASKIARRAVAIFSRNLPMPPPSEKSDQAELVKLCDLVSAHFGRESWQASAAALGVFVHHGNTPNGLRLATEHSMQQELIQFVVCTSTLAQGVNLPIRYLIVAGIQQGQHEISVRDFQNLLGRAGRAGIHTEGLVIFADPRTYDRRRVRPRNFQRSLELLDSENAEDTTSSLLSVIGALPIAVGEEPAASEHIVELLLSEPRKLPPSEDDDGRMVKELIRRRKLLTAVESYLMANRSSTTLDSFVVEANSLCEQTFAYYLANDDEKAALRTLFLELATSVHERIPEADQHSQFGRTLLGASEASEVFKWVTVNRDGLTDTTDDFELISVLDPLLNSLLTDRMALSLDPSDALAQIASLWIAGCPYNEIYDFAQENSFTKSWGQERRQLTEDDLIKLLHTTLAFDSTLIVSAICQFLGPEFGSDDSALGSLLKRLKYGVSSQLAVGVYEAGLADRSAAIRIAERLRLAGFSGDSFHEALAPYATTIEEVVSTLPIYFQVVLESLSSAD